MPNFVDAIAQRRYPTHPRDVDAHAATDRMIMEAFVPPKPNEFERTVRTAALLDWFATIFNSNSASPSRKLMFGGRNSSCSASRLMTASIAPAAPNEWPIIPFVELTATPSKSSAIALPSEESLNGVAVPWAFM